jgi:hypothetical protein
VSSSSGNWGMADRMRTSARAGTKSVLTEGAARKRIERERESLPEVPDRAHFDVKFCITLTYSTKLRTSVACNCRVFGSSAVTPVMNYFGKHRFASVSCRV